MSYQIIQQPGTDKFAVFDTDSGTIDVWDGTEDEIVQWFEDQAARQARRDVTHIIDEVKLGQPRRPYAQFKMSWQQALDEDREHNGDAWRESEMQD